MRLSAVLIGLWLVACIGTVDSVEIYHPKGLAECKYNLWLLPITADASLLVPDLLFVGDQQSETLHFHFVGPGAVGLTIYSASLVIDGRSYPSTLHTWEQSSADPSLGIVCKGETLPLHVTSAEWTFPDTMGHLVHGPVNLHLVLHGFNAEDEATVTYRPNWP